MIHILSNRERRSAVDSLREELFGSYTELTWGNKVKCSLVSPRAGKRVLCDVGGKCAKGLESNVLVRWPGVGPVPSSGVALGLSPGE